MQVEIPHTLNPGSIEIPASKSLAQRFILAAALAQKTTTLYNTGFSNDVEHLLETAHHLGANIEKIAGGVRITPKKNAVAPRFNTGESGLGVRLLMPVLGALGGKFTIKGTGSLNKRPMHDVIRLLEKNGVLVTSDDGFLPVTLEGKLRGGKLEIDGSKSSQYVSGLLMALPLCATDSELTVHDLSSKPYVDLTLDVLEKFGVRIERTGYEKFIIPGNQVYTPTADSFTIEGDYSAAANWIVAGAIGPNPITLKGLQKQSQQADRMMLEFAQKAGAILNWNENALQISRGKIQPFQADATDCPDLFPPLVVLAAAASGTSVITGIDRLVHKESNRALTLQTEFTRLGLSITFHQNDMHVHGTGHLNSGNIHAHNDHRIAMAGAIAALLTPQSVTVLESQAVTKSYPEFWAHCRIN